MQWLINFFASSIGKKIIMSLTGLFLILFLIVHLIGNLQLLQPDGDAFNGYTYFMTHNPLIKTISYGLYFFILLHAFQGLILAANNRSAKGSKYSVATKENAKWAAKRMAFLGLLILAFLLLHMGDFWLKMKMDQLNMVDVSMYDHPVKDLYSRVYVTFGELWIVIVYIIGLLALYFHLDHGFQSSFQTLGINHKKYTPTIKFLGKAYAILVPLGFAIIPLYIYFTK